MEPALKGIIHGKSIELNQATGLPEGQEVAVEIRPIPSKHATAPRWLERLDVNPAVRPGKFVIKGTHLLADELIARLEEGWSEEKLSQTHSELTQEDIAALHDYGKLPLEMRRCFGAWAEEGAELDEFLEWNRQQRKTNRMGIED